MRSNPNLKSLPPPVQKQDWNICMVLPQAVTKVLHWPAWTHTWGQKPTRSGHDGKGIALHFLGDRVRAGECYFEVYFPFAVLEAKQCHQAARDTTGQLGLESKAGESHEMGFPMAEVRTNFTSTNYSFLSRTCRDFLSKACPEREQAEVIRSPVVSFPKGKRKSVFQSSTINPACLFLDHKQFLL